MLLYVYAGKYIPLMGCVLQWREVQHCICVSDEGSNTSMTETTNQSKFERQFLSPQEIAKLTGIDVAIIRKAINDGELPAMRTSPAANAKRRVHVDDLWAWVRSKQQPPHG